MILKCAKCKKRPAIIHPTFGPVWCKKCQSEAQSFHKGKPINFTEGSDRIKKQREEHHDDLLQPHIYNKASKNLEINPEFINKYPDKVHLYFSDQEMRRAGFPKLAEYSQRVQKDEAARGEKRNEFKRRVIEYKQTRNPTNLRDFLKRL